MPSARPSPGAKPKSSAAGHDTRSTPTTDANVASLPRVSDAPALRTPQVLARRRTGIETPRVDRTFSEISGHDTTRASDRACPRSRADLPAPAQPLLRRRATAETVGRNGKFWEILGSPRPAIAEQHPRTMNTSY